MKKRYRVIYVGEDSCNHTVIVWATDGASAKEKVKRMEDVDFVMGVQRANTPIVIALVVIGIVVLLAISAAT